MGRPFMISMHRLYRGNSKLKDGGTMVSVNIWEPRYHDGMVLVAAYRLKKDEPVRIVIEKGFYEGKYIASAELIIHAMWRR